VRNAQLRDRARPLLGVVVDGEHLVALRASTAREAWIPDSHLDSPRLDGQIDPVHPSRCDDSQQLAVEPDITHSSIVASDLG